MRAQVEVLRPVEPVEPVEPVAPVVGRYEEGTEGFFGPLPCPTFAQSQESQIPNAVDRVTASAPEASSRTTR